MISDAKSKQTVLARFRKAVEDCGRSGTLLSEQQAAARLKDTLYQAAASEVPAVLLLSTEDEIRRALSHARIFGLSVHPISSGHNWGYG
jgi:FAD/FMN-containing dehydrogenase